MKQPLPRVLIIAGSDSGGGAGIQADIKTVTMLGGYAATAVTALTAQNTLGVMAIHPVPVAFIAQQIEAILSDIGADAIKTGMLHSAEVIELVADTIRRYPAACVIDPVMVATSGDALLEAKAEAVMLSQLIPLATVLTPNLPEAERLTGMVIESRADRVSAAQKLLAMGCKAVLLKGGHGKGEHVEDLLVSGDEHHWFASLRIDTTSTHGTGCTLASALATCLARGDGLYEAVTTARNYVHEAIRTAPDIGKGHGPLNHRVASD